MNQSSFELDRVTVRTGGKTLLHNLSLAIPPGKITAIIGPNGSGKSSLLKLLAGLLVPDQGQLILNGKSLSTYSRRALSRELALLPQYSPVPLGMTIVDLVACGRHPWAGPFGRLKPSDHQVIDAALARVGLTERAGQLVDRLSGGEMQRVWLAMVLAQSTGILLLDEPTSWLDIAHQLRLLEIVRTLNRERDVTIVWVLHDLNQAMQYSDHMVVVDQGRIVRSGAANAVLDKTILRAVFEVECRQVALSENDGDVLFVPQSSGVPA